MTNARLLMPYTRGARLRIGILRLGIGPRQGALVAIFDDWMPT